MADYRRMYAVLCKAIDDAIEPLEALPPARQIAETLRSALLEAEEIYITTSLEVVRHENGRVIELRTEPPEHKGH